MPETYRDQWEAAAAILRSHAAQFDELARTAPPRPQAAINEQFLTVRSYLLRINEDMDPGDGHKFIPPTAIDWIARGIVDRLHENDGSGGADA